MENRCIYMLLALFECGYAYRLESNFGKKPCFQNQKI
jgi:hypothetical protein